MSLLWPIIGQGLKNPRRTAVVDDQRSYSYGQLVGGAAFVAEKIDDTTALPHVGILLPTGGAFPIALLGAWLAGRVVVPLNYLLGADELKFIISDSDIDTVITVPAMLDFVGGPSVIPDGVRTLNMQQMDFSGFPPLRWPPLPSRDQTAVILYTSGTSGRPKGVMLTHGNLRSNVDAAIVHANITRADTFLGVLPQFHSFGLTALTLVPLRVGSKTVYSARFVPRKVVQLIRRHSPDIVMAVPSMYGALLSVKGAGPDDFKSIRFAISGGEPLPQATFDAFQHRFEVTLLEGYGLTETAPAANWSTPQRSKRHSVGPALPQVRVVIVDDKDTPQPPDVDGEILIAGPNIMKGYYHQPQQTAEVFVNLKDPDDGQAKKFFRTGDIGRLDDEGYLYITGRKKEMLIIGGENVFPREIEEVLNKHAAVRDSAVIGQTDGMRGEVPIAFVELEDGQSFDESGLRAWCREHLAQFKAPREIHHVESLPRNATGKILRRQLKVEAGEVVGA